MSSPQKGLVRRPPGGLLFLATFLMLIVVIVLSFGIGPLKVPPLNVMHVLGLKLGLFETGELTRLDIATVWNLRVPRALMAVIVGASLAMAGAGLQGLFGNPLADPGIVGITQGSALGAVIAIALNLSFFGDWTIPVAAFLGGAATTSVIYILARPGRETGTGTLLLVGIAIGAACSASIGLFTYMADERQLQALVFWQMGSLASIVDWSHLPVAIPAFMIGAIALNFMATPLDMLALGERQAQHLGLDVPRTRALLIAISALLVGSAVAFAGSIGFVGLVVPHFVRMIAGPGHRWLLPLSGVIGGMLLVIADTAARSLNAPNEIPLGLFSSALGTPFFLWLILLRRHQGGH